MGPCTQTTNTVFPKQLYTKEKRQTHYKVGLLLFLELVAQKLWPIQYYHIQVLWMKGKIIERNNIGILYYNYMIKNNNERK